MNECSCFNVNPLAESVSANFSKEPRGFAGQAAKSEYYISTYRAREKTKFHNFLRKFKI